MSNREQDADGGVASTPFGAPGREHADAVCPDDPVALRAGRLLELYVVRISEQALPAQVGWLDADERARMQRYRHIQARNELIAGRFLARHAFARVTGMAPAEIRFAIGAFGRPSLQPPREVDARGLAFSIAHSHGLVMLALGRRPHIGLDVEPVRRAASMLRLRRRILCETEWVSAQALSCAARERILLQRWIDKEAYGKSLGLGLQINFNRVSAEPLPGQRMRFASVDGSHIDRVMNHWYVEPQTGYLAALISGPAGKAAPAVRVHDFARLQCVPSQPEPRVRWLESASPPFSADVLASTCVLNPQ